MNDPHVIQTKPGRIQVSPGKRFDIFKRDCFTCLYCGRKPPEVILHLDHIIAVANGGTNDDTNLVTSCKDCNLGKSDKAMDQTPRFRPTDEDRREKLEQLQVMAQEMADRADLLDEQIDSIGNPIRPVSPQGRRGQVVAPHQRGKGNSHFPWQATSHRNHRRHPHHGTSRMRNSERQVLLFLRRLLEENQEPSRG